MSGGIIRVAGKRRIGTITSNQAIAVTDRGVVKGLCNGMDRYIGMIEQGKQMGQELQM